MKMEKAQYMISNKKNSIKLLSKTDWSDLSTELTEQIKKRTRLGKDNKGEKFKELSPEYKKYRSKYKSSLSFQTRPNKSNQTFTGQMVDAFIVTAKNTMSRILFVAGFNENRDDGITNSEVYFENTLKGRDFMGIAPFELSGLRKFIRDKVRKILA